MPANFVDLSRDSSACASALATTFAGVTSPPLNPSGRGKEKWDGREGAPPISYARVIISAVGYARTRTILSRV